MQIQLKNNAKKSMIILQKDYLLLIQNHNVQLTMIVLLHKKYLESVIKNIK